MSRTGASAVFERVPVVDLHSGNLAAHLQQIKDDVTASHFVAIDCELSGLGDRKKLNAASIDERYKNTGLVARTRSIISLGLSTFTLENIPSSSSSSQNGTNSQNGDSATNNGDTEGEPKSWTYRVRSYNIMVLCGEDYIVEPGSLRFLVEHGFDFTKQYTHGVSYLRGNDRKEEGDQPLRDIFAHLVKARKAIVLHNGLIDLVFLYHNFYAALPDKLGTFTSDLSEMFPCGIYDTKYIAEFVSRTQASFLEFVFRKEQKVNAEKFHKKRPHVKISFSGEDSDDVEWRHCGVEVGNGDGVEVCFSYAHHGHCPAGNSCDKSHDIDHIIRSRNSEKEKKSKKRKRPENGADESTNESENGAIDDSLSIAAENGDALKPEKPANSGGHRAGFDAFMTGFAFTTFLVHQTQIPHRPADFSAAEIKTDNMVNRVYLVCKDFPMLVLKSAFAKCSGEHDKKLRKLGLIQETAENV